MIRTFIAFEIDDKSKRECDYLTQKGKKLFPKDIKWVDYNNLHITFLFLGEIEQNDVVSVKNLLQELSEELPVFTLKNGQLRWNPPFKPKTLWIEYPNPFTEVTPSPVSFCKIRDNFIKKLKSELPYLKLDNKDFIFHLTLGRVKHKINIEKWLLHDEMFIHDVELKHISLYQSTLHPQGPIYRNLATIPLQAVET